MATKRYPASALPIQIAIVGLRGDTLRSKLYRHWSDTARTTRRDLTGCTLDARGSLSDGTLIDLNDYLVTDLANGEYRLVIPDDVSNGATPWPAGQGKYDITITDTLGMKTTYFAGPLCVKEGDQHA